MNTKNIGVYETGRSPRKLLYWNEIDNLPSSFSIELDLYPEIIEKINSLFCQERGDDSLSKLISNMEYDGASYLLTVKYVCTEKGVFYGSPEYTIYSLEQDLMNCLLMKEFKIVNLNRPMNSAFLERVSKKYEILPLKDGFYIKSLEDLLIEYVEDSGFFSSFFSEDIGGCFITQDIEVKNKELKKILFL